MPITKRKPKEDEQSVTSENKQPIKNVPALMGEGEKFYRDQLYTKAIQCYTEVLELSPGNTNALVERSACYLKTGRNDLALADAEESLKEDRKFTKGLYQKAEALYAMGEFELALVFYHRGKKLRGDVKEFQLGINKAQEAIDNCVGDPNTVKLEVKGDLSYFERPDEKPKKKTGGYVKPTTQKVVLVQKREKRQNKSANQKTIKQLLGELYADKVYLEHLLEDDCTTKQNTKSGDAIWTLANNGLDYLDSRTDFWRQQKPIYARRNKYAAGSTSGGADSLKNPLNYILKQLEAIDTLQTNGKYQESLNKSNKLMMYTNKLSESQIPDKKSIIANIYSNIGNAHLEMGNYSDALAAHQKDLEISTEIDNKEGISRALENIGRVYARNGKYKEAVEVWEKKLPLAESDLEKAWLYHEIGRCYLETDNYSLAKSYGQKSLECAEKINDDVWKRNATVLIAQSESKLGDSENLKSAIKNFEKALEYTEKEGDEGASRAIRTAVDDCRERLKKLQISSSPRDDERKEEVKPVAAKAPPVKAASPPPKPVEKPVSKSPPPPAKPLPPVDYEIQVKTSDEMSAGTDANVFISLFGDRGELKDLSLKTEGKSDLFEKNSLDIFTLKKQTDIGKIKKIKIGHDGLEKGSSWKLEYVKIFCNNTVYQFKANRWLDADFKPETEKYVTTELEPSSVDANLSRYEIHVKTADDTGAGTDSSVFLTIKGDSGELSSIELKNFTVEKKNLFEQDGLDRFIVYLKEIGKVQKVTVWHDGKGFGSSWKLEYIKVISNDGSTYLFEANRWIEKNKEELVPGKNEPAKGTESPKEKKASVDEAQNKKPPVATTSQKPATIQPPPKQQQQQQATKEKEKETPKGATINYEIHVKTSGDMSSGTDANVFISLFGDKGELPNLQLKNPEIKDSFEKDSLDVFVLDKLADIGKLKKIKIGHDGKNKGSSWKLEHVKIYFNNTTYFFKANRWLDIDFKAKEEKYASVELEPSSVDSNLNRFEVHVKTSDDTGAGTDSNVFLTLKGSSSELANVELKNHLLYKTKKLFEQNQTDKFVLYSKDIGKIQKMTIWHDNKGFGSSWKLEYVKIITNDSTLTFKANEWIEKNKLELSPSN